MEIIVNNQKMKVQIERKRIKNMYLRVQNGDTLFITAHPSVPVENIIEFIHSKEDWISKVCEKSKQKELLNRKGIEGPIIYIFGEKKYVRYEVSNRNDALLDDDIITFYLKEINSANILATFQKFARPLLMKVLEIQRVRWDRVIEDYNIHKLPQIKIRSMTSKWGSCMTHTAEITMNLSLIHYPLECIDYVLWHEYVHLIVPNHSKRFYQLVEYHMPNYKKYKSMLI